MADRKEIFRILKCQFVGKCKTEVAENSQSPKEIKKILIFSVNICRLFSNVQSGNFQGGVSLLQVPCPLFLFDEQEFFDDSPGCRF
jgi:hypothetical protein